MHRHGYQGRKLGRERDQRRALLKSLADSLILNESIETTLPKAKEVVPYTEKLITKAKKGDLHNRRLIMSSVMTQEAANKLVDEIAPKLTTRVSGHLRIVKTTLRRGDNAQLAKVSFVDDLTATTPVKSEKKPAQKVKSQTATKVDSSKKATKPSSSKKTVKSAPKAKDGGNK